MIHKAVNEFTEDEKNWMNTLAANYIIAQSTGFQQGYAQAVNDFKKSIIDYWRNSDDEPQESILDTLIDLGEQISKRKRVAEENIRLARKEGYEQLYQWRFKLNEESFPLTMNLLTKEFASDTSERIEEPENVTSEPENVRIEPESALEKIVEESSDKAAEIQSDPEQAATEDDPLRKGYGKWEEYKGKALSTLEQNLIIKGMTEEGYSLSQIATVVRLSQPTISNRRKKMKETGE